MGRQSQAKRARRAAATPAKRADRHWQRIRAAVEWAVRPHAGKVVTAEVRMMLRIRITMALAESGIRHDAALAEMKARGFVIAREYGLRDPFDLAAAAPEVAS